MYKHSTFPLSYGVPNANPTIKNLLSPIMLIKKPNDQSGAGICFDRSGWCTGSYILRTDRNVWSQNVVLNSPTQITAVYAIIRMM